MSGHYISLPRGAEVTDAVDPLEQTGVVGVQVRLMWTDLEPYFNEYNLDQLEWFCVLAHAMRRKVVLMIEHKTFTALQNPAPLYLHGSTYPNKQDGFTMALWQPEVYVRLVKLMRVIKGRNFPGFGGICVQESAPGLGPDALRESEYTPSKYIVSLLDLSETADFLYLNYMPGDSGALRFVINGAKCAVGGPDILPNNQKLIYDVYPHFTSARNSARIFFCAQFDSYRHKKPDGTYYTMDEILNFAADELRASTIFWNVTWEGLPRETKDAYAAIAERPFL